MEQYFYLDSNNQQQGPVDKNDLPRYGVTLETLVWKAGMANWRTVESIPELALLFKATESPSVPSPPPLNTIIQENFTTDNSYEEEKFYYLDSNNQQQGPVGKSDLLNHGVTAQTLVWKEGMSNWQAANTVPELTSLFKVTPEQPPYSGYTPPTGGPSVAPGSTNSYIQYREKPDNYLVWAILATVLCCVPAGIVAIVKASRVNSLWDMKRYHEAYQAAEDAKKWCIISVLLSVVFVFFYLVVGFGSLL